MTVVDELLVDGITVSNRRRQVNRERVKALASSIEEVGLQTPIDVWSTDDGMAVYLIAGQHRLEAFKMLGRDEIPCRVLDMSELDRELWEIDENLMRSDLTDLERADHTARRAEIVRQKTERAKLAQADVPPAERAEKGQGEFVSQTAKATGKSKRTVKRDKARGEKIADDVKERIADTDAADKGVELDALASMSHEEQRQAVDRVESGASENFRDARDFIKGVSVEEEKHEKQLKALWRAWLAATSDVRREFVQGISDWETAA